MWRIDRHGAGLGVSGARSMDRRLLRVPEPLLAAALALLNVLAWGALALLVAP